MPTINGTINKVAENSPIVINGGKTTTINGLRPHLYDKWRMNWNGHHFAPPDVGSVLYLPGVPGFGSTIFDFSGSGNDGTITGATWKRLPSGLVYLDFDGVNNRVNLGDNASLNPSKFTIKVWYNSTEPTSNDSILALGYDATNKGVYMGIFGGGQAMLLRIGDGTDLVHIATPVATAVWEQIVFTYDGVSTGFAYLNGVKDAETLTQDPPSYNAQDDLMGAHSTGERWKGGIALLEVLGDVVWNQDEVSENYSQERHLLGV